MPYEFYKVLHIFGLILALTAIGAIAHQMFFVGTKDFAGKRAAMIFHGLGTVFVLVSGFGLMARIGIAHSSWPHWIYVKLSVWFLVLALAPTLLMRLPKPKLWAWWVIPALLLLAVTAAVYKDRLI